MSIESRSWAWSLEHLRPAAKLTLLAIADVADEEGRCYCSQRRLIKLTYQSEGTIKRILRELEQLGLIVRYPRFAEGGARIPDGFALQLSITKTDLAALIGAQEAVSDPEGEGSKMDPGEGVNLDPPGVTADSPPESLVTPPNKPDSNPISPLPPCVPVERSHGLSGGESVSIEPKTETPKRVTKFYGKYSQEGAAIRVIAALGGVIIQVARDEWDVPASWRGQDPITKRLGYWVRFELNPRLISLGQLERDGPIKPKNWDKWPIGTNQAGSWRALLRSVGLEPPDKDFVRAPWPFPPRADGSLSVSEDATGPPVVPPMSEREKREFAGS